MNHAAFGSGASGTDIEAALQRHGLAYEKLLEQDLIQRTAKAIADGQIVGWFQGKMEFGPRALGQRSILADPRHAHMKDALNHRIKRRESFRPFAPAVPEEKAREYLKSRHTTQSAIETFNIGYSPNQWDNLFKFLAKKGYPADWILTSACAVSLSVRI